MIACNILCIINRYRCIYAYSVFLRFGAFLGNYRIDNRYRTITVFLCLRHSVLKLVYYIARFAEFAVRYQLLYRIKLIIYIVTYLRFHFAKMLFFKLIGIFQRIKLIFNKTFFLNYRNYICIYNVRRYKNNKRRRQKKGRVNSVHLS